MANRGTSTAAAIKGMRRPAPASTGGVSTAASPEQAPLDLEPCRTRIPVGDQAAFPVAFDLGQLITVDRQLEAAARHDRAAAKHRPQDRQDGDAGEDRERGEE